jgi:anti-sigma regulatory factor (Ser/Thr protein kinase)
MKVYCLLFAQSQLLNQIAVSFYIFSFEVVEQAAPLSHQLDQPSPGVMVLGVGFEVIRQIVDTLTQDGHLHFRGAGVRFMQTKPVNDVPFLFRV